MVVIIGTTHHNTLSIVRSFGLVGEEVDVILHDGVRDSYILKSKYIRKSYVEKNENSAYDCLLRNYSSAVIIACSDAIASVMDANYNAIKARYKFFNCGEQGLLTQYMDKECQARCAAAVGIETPKTMMHTIGERFAEPMEYPCILKPLKSISGGKTIKVCFDEIDLENALSAFELGSKILIQQYIKKDFEIVLPGVRINGNTIIPGYVHKHRDRLGGTTYSTVHPVCKLPDSVIQSSIQLVESMNYEGLFGIELIVKDGKFYFVEINLRNDATTYALAIAGCNVPNIYYQAVRNFNIDYLKYPVREVDAMVEFTDILFALKGQVPIIKWIKQRNNCECLYFNNREDMGPYYAARWCLISYQIKRLIRL